MRGYEQGRGKGRERKESHNDLYNAHDVAQKGDVFLGGAKTYGVCKQRYEAGKGSARVVPLFRH